MKENKSMIYGRHPVMEAILAGQEFEKLVMQRGITREFEVEVMALCKERDIVLQLAPKEKMNRITRNNHQGIIGFMALVQYYKIADLLPKIREKGETPLLILLDGITDVRNFGAIARSAECCGVHALIVPDKGIAQINEDAIKTSAGALAKIPVCRENSLIQTMEFLQNEDLQVLASSLEAATPIDELDLTLPTVIVLGSESKGISKKILQGADQRFIIPQIGTTDSFNVSVAAGISLYEVNRQRRKRVS